MDPEVSRQHLGSASKALSPAAMAAALELSGLRPTQDEWRRFTLQSMQGAGVLSLAAGMVFLVAFNWQQIGLYGRFAMVEVPMLLALAVAWIKGLDKLSGKLALMLAVMLTGALLALFGQTYQTGADVYELFLGWAVLTLPWVIACRFSPCWALWLLLINLSALFYSGWSDHIGPFSWIFSSRLGLTAWALPFVLNTFAYIGVEALLRSKAPGFEARWLGRGVMTAAMGFATTNVVILIAELWKTDTPKLLTPLMFIAASVGLFAYAFWRRDELFPFAVLALSWLVATTTILSRAMIEAKSGIGGVLVVAVYIIVAAAGAARGIAYLGGLWKVRETAA